MPSNQTNLRVTLELPLPPARAFEVITDDLTFALGDAGITFEPGPRGRVADAGDKLARVTLWQPGERLRLEWEAAPWMPGEIVQLEFFFESVEADTRITFEQRGLAPLINNPEELAGWFAGNLFAPLLKAMTPAQFGDWVTDRRARRPAGAQARETYGNPIYHYPNFRVLLAELALQPGDYLLEVGCGGGALLKQALQSGCRAAAIDHSPDMVRLAREKNREAVEQGRAIIQEASAEKLPFAKNTFTCAVMTGVLGFLPEPVTALREMLRTLQPGGRLAMLGADPELRGTPAAPEPMASRLRFYEPNELEELARQAGFQEARVVRRDLEVFARECGVPEAHLPLFQGPGAQFLLARKL
jgi:SAM-dependent methyltransferase/uncharacterized protein YndB with AHSA1/START domain